MNEATRVAAQNRLDKAERDLQFDYLGLQTLYDRYFLLFQLAGLILLVAMIGAILLTLRHRKDIKRQNVLAQMWRDPAKAMETLLAQEASWGGDIKTRMAAKRASFSSRQEAAAPGNAATAEQTGSSPPANTTEPAALDDVSGAIANGTTSD